MKHVKHVLAICVLLLTALTQSKALGIHDAYPIKKYTDTTAKSSVKYTQYKSSG